MSAVARAVVTTQNLLDAFEAHGPDYLVIGIDSIKTTKFAQYVPVNIKLADGTVVYPYYWKLSNQGITTCSTLKKPTERCFAQVRVGVSQLASMDGEMVETDNMLAMRQLCESYELICERYKSEKIFTDNDKAPRKQPDGKTFRPVYLISTKIVTPMRTVTLDRTTGEMVDMDQPDYWLTVSKKKFYQSDETPKESVHYNNLYYFDSDKKCPDLDKPIMTIEYAPTFYNIDQWTCHPRSGKKIYKKLASNELGEEVDMDNTNIHTFLTRGSAMIGCLKFEMVVTGRQAKLEIELHRTMHVHPGTFSQEDAQDDDDLEDFSTRYANITVKPTYAVNDDIDEPDADDF